MTNKEFYGDNLLAIAMENDETVKSKIAEDMSLVEDECDYIDIEPPKEVPEGVDPETGEIIESTGDPDMDEILKSEQN